MRVARGEVVEWENIDGGGGGAIWWRNGGIGVGFGFGFGAFQTRRREEVMSKWQ